MAANIVGGRDGKRRGVTQRPGDMGIRERLAPTVADGEIEPFAGQRDQPVGDLKLQMQLGMLMQKGAIAGTSCWREKATGAVRRSVPRSGPPSSQAPVKISRS